MWTENIVAFHQTLKNVQRVLKLRAQYEKSSVC